MCLQVAFTFYLIQSLREISISMDSERKEQLEYEEQLYKYSSEFILDCFKTCLMEETESKIAMLVNNIEKKMMPGAANPEEFTAHLAELQANLKKEYMSALEVAYQKNKADALECMAIPKHVLLTEDIPVKLGLQVDTVKTENEISEIKEKVKQTLIMEKKIVEEMDEAANVLKLLENTLALPKLNIEEQNASIQKLTQLLNTL